MCVLKAFSATSSFKPFADSTALPVYSCYDKGEVHSVKSGEMYKEYRISFDVSDQDWDEFPAQVDDAISFLERWSTELSEFKASYQPNDLVLDFPLWSRLDHEIANQNDTLPSKLIILAGQLGISIAMSIYSRDAFDEAQ